MDKKILFASGLLATLVVELVMLMLMSHTAITEPTVRGVPFTRLMYGEQSPIASRVNYVLTSPEELNALWTILGATSTPPTVDFTTHAVLAVFAGASPKTKVTVAKIEDVQDTAKRLVSIVIAKPAEPCTTPSISPYEIVSVAASSFALTHTDIVTTTTCSD
jgi:hypothetical protein